jgi:RNA polymerase sigma-70 factor (ECF subfamily)
VTKDVEEARWRELRARLHGFVGRRVGNPEDAEDVVQDVFVRMQRNIDALTSADRLDAWAFRIARNAVADHYRSRGRRDLTGEAASKAMEGLGADAAEPTGDARAEMAHCIAPMVRGLPDAYRRAIELTELEGMSQAAAAERLGLSVPGAKSRVQRGRARLRRCSCAVARSRPTVAARARVSSPRGRWCASCGDSMRKPGQGRLRSTPRGTRSE